MKQLSRNEVTKQSVSSRFTGYEIASLTASGMAQASLSTASRSHLLHASRGTCPSLYIVLAMTGYMDKSGLPKHPFVTFPCFPADSVAIIAVISMFKMHVPHQNLAVDHCAQLIPFMLSCIFSMDSSRLLRLPSRA